MKHTTGHLTSVFQQFSLAYALIACVSCKSQPAIKTPATDAAIEYMGRIKKEDDDVVIFWPGTSATLQFTGTTVSADLKDEKGNNFFYCIVDGRITDKIRGDANRHIYVLAEGLKKGPHILQLFKLTEESAGNTWLYGFASDGKLQQQPPGKRPVIQFYGNSITAGYSVDDTAADSKAPVFFNNYYTYAAITARHYNAQYTNISKSGIGVMVSWFPIIMPELYDRIDPQDSVHKWNYTNDSTDIVVVDLLQNDSWLVEKPEHIQFKARFGIAKPTERQIVAGYEHFIRTLRSKHPRATIICTLGSMDATKERSLWPGYIQQAVTAMSDKKIMTCFFPYKGAQGHPKRKDHQAMADVLIRFIDENKVIR